MGDDDRAAILRRRNRPIGFALSGLATSGSDTVRRGPCLETMPIEEADQAAESDLEPCRFRVSVAPGPRRSLRRRARSLPKRLGRRPDPQLPSRLRSEYQTTIAVG